MSGPQHPAHLEGVATETTRLAVSPSDEQQQQEVGEEHQLTPGQRKLVLVFLCLSNFSGILIHSIIAPFYPKEARDKGVNQTVVGLIFGVFQFVMFLSSPFFGKIAPSIGFKLVYIVGVYVSGVSCIAFGFLHHIEDRVTFIALCFLVRICEALGTAALFATSFVVVSIIFNDQKSFVFGIIETSLAVGLMAGPPIGGGLYEVGGYPLPFLVVGGVLCTLATVFWRIFPRIHKPDRNQSVQEGNVCKLLSIWSLNVCLATVIVAGITVLFIESVLEYHLKQFNLGPGLVGLFFLCLTVTYAVTAPIFGYLADKKRVDSLLMMLFGSLLGVISMNLVGPAPFLNFPPTLWLIGLSLGVMGISIELMFVVPFSEIFNRALSHGFPDDMRTSSMISGIYTSAFYLGTFIGPTLGNPMVEYIGFSATTSYLSLIHVVMALVLTFMFVKERFKR